MEKKSNDFNFVRLEDTGIYKEFLIGTFANTKGIELKPEDLFKVSYDNEGKNISFETLDEISIVVPVHVANGGWNKVE